MLLLDLIGIKTYGIVTGVADLIMSFMYNKLYIQDLINGGFKPNDEASANILKQKNIYFNGLAE